MIKGFHHAAISTPDLKRCIHFYTETIGGAVAWEFGWERGTPEADAVTSLTDSACRAAMLKIGDTFLEVFEFSSPTPVARDALRPVNNHGITHVCLEVTDIHDEYQRLKAAGMQFHTEPMAQDGSSMVYGRDPDGNVVELIEFTG
jgi:catechol 2,3-dioxygenase-like lactoylglutathione lyase family enzyme